MELTDEFVIIKDKPLILLLRNLGAAIEEGKSAKIPLIEAAFFAEKRKLPFTREEIIERAKKNDPLAEQKAIVISHLRSRGYITRVSADTTEYLRLHRKGFRPGEDRTYYLLKVVDEQDSMNMDSIHESLAFAGSLRKDLVLAVVKGNRPYFVKLGRINFE
jgi:tRNA splicing endonuclease